MIVIKVRGEKILFEILVVLRRQWKLSVSANISSTHLNDHRRQRSFSEEFVPPDQGPIVLNSSVCEGKESEIKRLELRRLPENECSKPIRGTVVSGQLTGSSQLVIRSCWIKTRVE